MITSDVSIAAIADAASGAAVRISRAVAAAGVAYFFYGKPSF